MQHTVVVSLTFTLPIRYVCLHCTLLNNELTFQWHFNHPSYNISMNKIDAILLILQLSIFVSNKLAADFPMFY